MLYTHQSLAVNSWTMEMNFSFSANCLYHKGLVISHDMMKRPLDQYKLSVKLNFDEQMLWQTQEH